MNQFFAELADYSRRAGLGGFAADERDFGREGLHTWRSEESITEFYGNKITPDGYGCWHENGRWLGFFLEHDTGTEPLRRVADKIDRYTGSGKPYTDRFDVARRLAGMVLIWTTSTRREQGLRKAVQAKYSPSLWRPRPAITATWTARRARSGPPSPRFLSGLGGCDWASCPP